jgi:hypothetical protein
MFVKLCFHHNSVNSQLMFLTFGVICSWKLGASNGTNSPVHNRLQPVFYWLLFMSNLCATATATDPDPGQLDLKSGPFLWSSPVQLPVHMTRLSNTSPWGAIYVNKLWVVTLWCSPILWIYFSSQAYVCERSLCFLYWQDCYCLTLWRSYWPWLYTFCYQFAILCHSLQLLPCNCTII